MSYVERLKAIVKKHGGNTDGIKTISDAIKALEGLEAKTRAAAPAPSLAPKKGLADPE